MELRSLSLFSFAEKPTTIMTDELACAPPHRRDWLSTRLMTLHRKIMYTEMRLPRLFNVRPFCVFGTFVVNVTQTSYQAEENSNITLEWTFTTKPDRTLLNSLSIYCELLKDLKESCLYHLHEGVEVPESQDEQFAGRVQWDKDVLREGRIRLHVSRLRTEDSGLYLCEVLTNYGGDSGTCRLSVTAAVDEPEPQRPEPERPEPERPESWAWIGLYVGLTAALLAVIAGLCFAFLCFTKSTDEERNVSAVVETLSFSEQQPIRSNRTLSGSSFHQNESSERLIPIGGTLANADSMSLSEGLART